MTKRKVFGYVEKVNIPNLGIKNLVAKVDTGAFSGALHCTDIKLDKKTGRLKFNPTGNKKLRIELVDFEIAVVRSTSGHQERRYVVPIDLIVQGESYKTLIGLTDRSDMRREMLIGRRFLREHNILVDVTRNEEYDEEWSRIES